MNKKKTTTEQNGKEENRFSQVIFPHMLLRIAIVACIHQDKKPTRGDRPEQAA